MKRYIIFFETYLGYKDVIIINCDSQSEAISIFEREYPLSEIDSIECDE